MANLLLVEDDRLLNDGISYALRKEHNITSVYSYQDAMNILKEQDFNLALLDIALPDGNGLELCRKIREKADIPVIFLTAMDTSQDMIEGFRAGCDDYIAKPFEIAILKCRINAVLRRIGNLPANIYKCKNLTVNFDKMQVFKDDKEIKLTATEYKLLTILIKNKDQVMPRELLISKLWDINENFVDENTLNVNIQRLRYKIEDDPKKPRFIITVFGIGYTWGDQ